MLLTIASGGCCGERGHQDGERRRWKDGGRSRVQEIAHGYPWGRHAATEQQPHLRLHQHRRARAIVRFIRPVLLAAARDIIAKVNKAILYIIHDSYVEGTGCQYLSGACGVAFCLITGTEAACYAGSVTT